MIVTLSADDAFRICASALDPLGYKFDRYDVILAASNVLEQVEENMPAAEYNRLAARFELDTAA